MLVWLLQGPLSRAAQKRDADLQPDRTSQPLFLTKIIDGGPA
jgi:hypothetical protein